MSFDVVASSRVEQRKITAGRHVLATGIQFGVAGAFLGIVGILSMFNNRPIIVGTLTLGYATLACIPLAAGILAARRELYPNALQKAAGGLAAGAIAVAIIALLPIVMSLVNLRTIFVALDQPLLKMLSFELNPVPAGIGCLLVFGIVLGGLGALLVMLPQRIRRPLVGGIIGAGIAGLFQELIRPILANSSVTKPLHDLLYTWSGLKLQGAVIMLLVAAAAVLVWDRNRPRVAAAFGRLDPRTQRRIRWGYITLAMLLAVLFPIYAGNFVGQVLLMVGLFILMGMGLNLEVGIAGLLDLGFVAFYAVGAYTTALLMADSPFALAHLSYWEAMPIAVLCFGDRRHHVRHSRAQGPWRLSRRRDARPWTRSSV